MVVGASCYYWSDRDKLSTSCDTRVVVVVVVVVLDPSSSSSSSVDCGVVVSNVMRYVC